MADKPKKQEYHHIPQIEIDSLARLLLPQIQAYYQIDVSKDSQTFEE